MEFRVSKIIILSIVYLAGAITYAQATKPSIKTEINEKSNDEIKYKLTLSAKTKLQAETQEDGSRYQNIDYALSPGANYKEYGLSTDLVYTQDLLEPHKSELGDIPLNLSRESWKYEYYSLNPDFSILLPVKEKTKNVVELKYSWSAFLTFALNTKTLLFEDLKLSYGVGYTRNITEYDTNNKGDPNIAYRIRQRFSASYKITEKISIKGRFQFDSNYSTDDDLKNSFTHLQSVEYEWSKKISLSAGHSNSDSLYHKETVETNLKFYDKTTSEFFFGLNYSI